jgi:hypothetical protein
MAMSERRREYLERIREERRALAAARGPLPPAEERRILAGWLLMGLPDPLP